MNNLARIVTAVLGVAAFALPANAQIRKWSGAPSVHGIWNPIVGQGGVYEFSSKNGGKRTMEMAIVGKDTFDGKEAFWYQMTMESNDAGGKMISKHLIVRTGEDIQTVRMIMQIPGQQPMEMSGMLGQHQQSNQPADINSEAQDVGTETITVPAGTFSCEHFRMNDGSGDAWLAKDVTPFGLVKYQGNDSSMVLVKVVSDAKDKIVGKPVPFNPQAFMQQPPQ